MKSILSFLQHQSLPAIWIISIGVTLIIGLGDLYTGTEISTSIFYVIPIAIASWYANRSTAIIMSIFAAIIWMVTDIGGGAQYSYAAIYIWNMLVRLGLFLIIAVLLGNFKELLVVEAAAADTDYLTGVLNTRGFNESVQQEIDRCARTHQAFSIAYIDLDNFKSVNDAHGHSTGDKLLISVAETLKDNLRKIDVVARIGGDEYAVLFVETDSVAAKLAFSHSHGKLVKCMRDNNWPVTFSVGVVTFETPPVSTRQALDAADEMMYVVKHNLKNSVVYKTWKGDK